jgi:periplasmic protein CpxP/Spy
MKSVRQPFSRLNSLVLAALLATAGASAIAQTAPVTTTPAPTATSKPAGPPGERMGRHDPAKMQAMMAKRQAEMKAKLKITPAQEGAWTSFTAAMQPPARMGGRPTPEQRAEFAKLTTPERIDKMRALRTERMTQMSAAMDKRGEATKTFYAALTPEQQKVFDTEHKKHGPHGGRGGPGHHGAAGPMKG